MSMTLQKAKLTKISQKMGSTLHRYFVMDNQQITYFRKEKDESYQKSKPLEGAVCVIEKREEAPQGKGLRWTERDQKYRLQLILKSRNNRPLFVYSNSLDELKTIKGRAMIASTVTQISDPVEKYSKDMVREYYFKKIWKLFQKVVQKRRLLMVSFGMMGMNMVALGQELMTIRVRALRNWNNQIQKREKKHHLRSNFLGSDIYYRDGAGDSIYKSSALVREQLRRVEAAFKNRRTQRHPSVQDRLTQLMEEDARGMLLQNVGYYSTDRQGEQKHECQFASGRLKIDPYKFVLFENDSETGDIALE